MTATNHALTGAIVALTVREPAAAIVLAFLTHFFLDSLPHFGIKDEDIMRRTHNNGFLAVIVIDMILLIIVTLWQCLASHSVANWIVLACGSAAVSPDIANIPQFFKNMRGESWDIGGWFTRFHRKVQNEHVWGLAVELGWLVAAVVTIAIIE